MGLRRTEELRSSLSSKIHEFDGYDADQRGESGSFIQPLAQIKVMHYLVARALKAHLGDPFA